MGGVDVWTKGAVFVLVAYVVVVAIGLLLGRRPMAVAHSSLIIIGEAGNSAVELGWLLGTLSELGGPVFVVDAGNPVTSRMVARRLERCRHEVCVVTAGPDDLQGLKLICGLAGRRTVAVLSFRDPDIPHLPGK